MGHTIFRTVLTMCICLKCYVEPPKLDQSSQSWNWHPDSSSLCPCPQPCEIEEEAGAQVPGIRGPSLLLALAALTLPISSSLCGASVGRFRCTKPCLFGHTCPPAVALITEWLFLFVKKPRTTVFILHSECLCTWPFENIFLDPVEAPMFMQIS